MHGHGTMFAPSVWTLIQAALAPPPTASGFDVPADPLREAFDRAVPSALDDRPAPDFSRLTEFAKNHAPKSVAHSRATGRPDRVGWASLRHDRELLFFPDGSTVLDLGPLQAHLGRGAYKTANKAIDLDSGALKAVFKPVDASQDAHLDAELRASAALGDIPQVSAIRASGWVDKNQRQEFRLVQDLCKGDLVQLGDRMTERTERIRFALDIMKGVAAIHRRGWAHGDIKPDNLLVDDDGRGRVADLGTATNKSTRGVAGTAAFFHPDRIHTQALAGLRAAATVPVVQANDTYATALSLSAWYAPDAVAFHLDRADTAFEVARLCARSGAEGRAWFARSVDHVRNQMIERHDAELRELETAGNALPEQNLLASMRNPDLTQIRPMAAYVAEMESILADASTDKRD